VLFRDGKGSKDEAIENLVVCADKANWALAVSIGSEELISESLSILAVDKIRRSFKRVI